jgi:hypothetical protein
MKDREEGEARAGREPIAGGDEQGAGARCCRLGHSDLLGMHACALRSDDTNGTYYFASDVLNMG